MPAVEPGILPGGSSARIGTARPVSQPESGRQDAALYGSQDDHHYNRKRVLAT